MKWAIAGFAAGTAIAESEAAKAAERRVAALEEPVLANIDEALSFLVQRVDDYYVEQARTALNRARALLAAAPSDHDCLMPSACGVTGFYCANSRPAALPAEADPWCRIDEPHTHGGTDEYGPHPTGRKRGKR